MTFRHIGGNPLIVWEGPSTEPSGTAASGILLAHRAQLLEISVRFGCGFVSSPNVPWAR
jgi:hypothetical protein